MVKRRDFLSESTDSAAEFSFTLPAGEERHRIALAEKEALLREFGHRTKNILTMIISLLRLQAGSVKNAEFEALVQSLETRIRSIALVYEKVCHSSNLDEVDLADYVREMVKHLSSVFAPDSRKIKVVIEAQPVRIGLDLAVPCGQIMNEILFNAFKHAFRGKKKGHIRIGIGQTRRTVALRISDDGVGFPPDYKEGGSSTLGLPLIRGLVRQLNGRVTLKTSPGVAWTVRFETPAGGLR
jgi:two-component sensor histidine kinase